jgi:Berberine and berberine like
VAAGEGAVAPFRAIAEPIADTLGPTRYQTMLPPATEADHPKAVGRTMFLQGVDVEAAATMIGHLAESDAATPVVQLRVLGGAMARVPADDTAYAHRSAPLILNVAALCDDPHELPAGEAWADDLARRLHQRDGASVGFLGTEGPARVRQAYPDTTWDRLTEIKGRYDPDNLFRLNHNIPPAIRTPRSTSRATLAVCQGGRHAGVP